MLVVSAFSSQENSVFTGHKYNVSISEPPLEFSSFAVEKLIHEAHYL